jgi:pyoverdine/dityrosine biosynthesis protein Dit1
MKKEKKMKANKNRIFLALIIIVLLIALIGIFITYPTITNFAIKENSDSPFNLKVDIPDSRASVFPGENLLFTAKVLNLANKQRIDITLKFEIKGANEKIIASKSETVAVETQASFVREIKIPEDSMPGTYTLITDLIYQDNKEAEAKNSFKVSSKNLKKINYILIIGILTAIILLAFLSLKFKKILGNIKIKLKIHNIVKNKLKIK